MFFAKIYQLFYRQLWAMRSVALRRKYHIGILEKTPLDFVQRLTSFHKLSIYYHYEHHDREDAPFWTLKRQSNYKLNFRTHPWSWPYPGLRTWWPPTGTPRSHHSKSFSSLTLDTKQELAYDCKENLLRHHRCFSVHQAQLIFYIIQISYSLRVVKSIESAEIKKITVESVLWIRL